MASLETLKSILGDIKDIEKPGAPSTPAKVTTENDLINNDSLETEYLNALNRIDLKLNDDDYYLSETRKFHQVKKQVVESKQLLEELMSYLSNFEKNLSNLSKQMNSLKNQSESLNSQLINNTNFEKKIIPIVTDLIISPEIINSILKDQINSSLS